MTDSLRACGPDDQPGRISYATLSAQAASALVAAEYGLGPLPCRLLRRGFNDVYAVGEEGVLRVSGRRARGPADVAAETAFLARLDAAGVAVAAARARRDGTLHGRVAMPDGERAFVLFRWAEGRVPDPDSAGDAAAQAAALAQVHAVDGGPEGRQRLDLDHLLHRPVAWVRALAGVGDGVEGAALAALAGRLAEGIGRLRPGLSWVRLHGDCHGMNARIRPDGLAVLFDFDDGGPGYLAYDLAVHLWAQVSFGRTRHAVWRAFDAAYRHARPLSAGDAAAVPWFVAVRHVWLMGEWAAQSALWGSESMGPHWLRDQLAFLHGWEVERLGRMLV